MPDVQRVYGRASLPTGVETDVWTLGTTVPVYPWPTEARPLRIRAGGNPADTAAGAGARLVVVDGLDDDFNPITDVLFPAGAAQSAQTVAVFRRVQLAVVLQAGTYSGSNVGAITIEDNLGVALAHIPAQAGVAHMSQYTVPAGFRAMFTAVAITVPGNKAATLRFKIRRDADVVGPPATAALTVTQYDEFLGSELVDFPKRAAILEPKTDLWLTGNTLLGGGSSCSIEYQLELWR